MKYELQELEKILVSLQPRNFNAQKNKQAYITRSQADAVEEVKRITFQLLQNTSNGNVYASCYHVQQHQHGIIAISNKLFSYIELPEGILQYPALIKYRKYYTSLLVQLQKLLSDIVQFLPDYCDKRAGITDYKRYQLIPAISCLIEKVKGLHADTDLVDIILAPLKDFKEFSITKTQQEYEYMEHYLATFRRLMDKEIAFCDLLSFSVTVNYNASSMYHYYIDYLINNGDNGFYKMQLKMLKQLRKQVRQCMLFDPQSPALYELLINWLKEELKFAKPGSTHVVIDNEVEKKDDIKIQTELTVAHLSFAVKLLLDTGVFKNTNATDLIRVIARYFTTPRSKFISEGSMRNKIYNVERAAVVRVQDVFMTLVNEARKY